MLFLIWNALNPATVSSRMAKVLPVTCSGFAIVAHFDLIYAYAGSLSDHLLHPTLESRDSESRRW
jgi:hypothetical protein